MADEFPKIRIVKGRLHLGFNTATATSAGAVVIHSILERVPPWARLFIRQFQIWFGHQGTIADDEEFDIFLSYLDVEQVPDASSLIASAIWQGHQRFEEVGTGANMLQTMERDNMQWSKEDAPQLENTTVSQRRIVSALAILVSATMSKTVEAVGTVDLDVEHIVRTWGNDAYTWNSANGKNPEGLMWEEAEGELG